jgi:hypothetical protein
MQTVYSDFNFATSRARITLREFPLVDMPTEEFSGSPRGYAEAQRFTFRYCGRGRSAD